MIRDRSAAFPKVRYQGTVPCTHDRTSAAADNQGPGWLVMGRGEGQLKTERPLPAIPRLAWNLGRRHRPKRSSMDSSMEAEPTCHGHVADNLGSAMAGCRVTSSAVLLLQPASEGVSRQSVPGDPRMPLHLEVPRFTGITRGAGEGSCCSVAGLLHKATTRRMREKQVS